MNATDYGIVGAYFAAMIWLGLRFKKNAARTDYFLGGRAFGWFPLAMSTMAKQLSAVSFVSAPAFVGLRAGGGMQWLAYELGVPLAIIAVLSVIAPMLQGSGVVSVYTFLEGRFGRSSRLLLSALFILTRALGTGVTIYVIALVLASILRLTFLETMLILGGVTIAYSLKGGMKAIVYSEVAQMIIKLIGIVVIALTALNDLGGWQAFLAHHDPKRLQIVNFSSLGFDGREYGFWPMLVGGIFLYTAYYGTDQTQAQRLLAARDEATVRRLLLFNGLCRFPITLAYSFGCLILGAFALANPEFRTRIPADQPDLMIPTFIAYYLPHGIIGILVVALIAAWMSAYSSTLNSLTAVTMEDFIAPLFAIPKDRYVARSKSVLLGWGVITLLFGFFAGKIAATAIEAINKVGSLAYGPILGIFLLAALPRITPLAANAAVLSGVGVNLTLWLFFPKVFWFWWNAIGGVTTLAVGMMLSLLWPVAPPPRVQTARSASPFPYAASAALLFFFGCIVAFCWLLPRMI
jgi:SSS family transporter